jgi:DNA-binding NarL/FixJ family response regulator
VARSSSFVQAGARGYLLKGADGVETLRAVQAVSRGEAIFSPGVAQRLIDYFAAPRSAAFRASSSSAFPDLTQRERAVLDLLAAGYSNAAIAARLVLSPKTVRNNVSRIFSKLQVAGRAEAMSARARLAWGALHRPENRPRRNVPSQCRPTDRCSRHVSKTVTCWATSTSKINCDDNW